MSMIQMKNVCGMRRNGDGTFSVTVESGLTLTELRKMIHERRFPKGQTEKWDPESLKALEEFEDAEEYFFPPDPTEATAELGGIAACNSSGHVHTGTVRQEIYRGTPDHSCGQQSPGCEERRDPGGGKADGTSDAGRDEKDPGFPDIPHAGCEERVRIFRIGRYGRGGSFRWI